MLPNKTVAGSRAAGVVPKTGTNVSKTGTLGQQVFCETPRARNRGCPHRQRLVPLAAECKDTHFLCVFQQLAASVANRLCLWSAPHEDRYAGLDVGEHRLFAAVIDTDMEPSSISFSPDTEPTLSSTGARTSPHSVAIDSSAGAQQGARERLATGGLRRSDSESAAATALPDWGRRCRPGWRWACVAIPELAMR